MSSTPQPAVPSWQRGRVAGWIVSVDHKRVGALYLAWAVVFLLVGGSLTLLMRIQMTKPDAGFLGDSTYAGMRTMHGTMLVFFVFVPVLVGLATFLVPLMIGADRDREAGSRLDVAVAVRLRRGGGRPLRLREGRLVGGGLGRVPAGGAARRTGTGSTSG